MSDTRVEIMARALYPKYWEQKEEGWYFYGQHARDYACEQAQAVHAALRATGLDILPVEPTLDMAEQGAASLEPKVAAWTDGPTSTWEDTAEVYRAMVSAYQGGSEWVEPEHLGKAT